MPGTPMPWVKAQFFTDAGIPAAGYQLFVYDAGTTNKATTWSEDTLTTPNANPVVLDSSGRANIFLGAQLHKFVLATPTAADPPAGGDQVWTVDNVASIPYYEINTTVSRVGTQIEWTSSDSVLTLLAPYSPVVMANYYVNNGTGSVAVDVPAGLLHNGSSALGSLVCEWEVDYASADLDARATMFGSNEDLGVGSASTAMRAKYVVYPSSNTTVEVSQTVTQNSGGGNAQVACAQTQIASLNLTTTGYTVVMGMASGTWTIRGARMYFLKKVADLLG